MQLRSGGYIVLTRPKRWCDRRHPAGDARTTHIEDTALKTKLEAAEEIARQLRAA